MAIVASTTILNGKYKIIREIGQGGMGRVWLAEELVFGSRPVALKEPLTDLPPAELDEVKQRYAQEVQINLALQKVDAPNVVRVYTVEPFDGSSLLCMAFMPNGDLAQLLAQSGGKLPVEQALEITEAILQALRAGHEHPLEIVHRDVKPSNVLFDGSNKPYLADFGLAQLSGASSRSQAQTARAHPGTPAYMAPEQVISTAYLTPAADVYAVGCVLFEMLTGTKYKRVRPGTTAGSLRPDTPVWVDAVLAKATAEDPFDRYGSAGDMLNALAAGRAQAAAQKEDAVGSTIPVTPAGNGPPPDNNTGRRRLYIAVALILLALLVGGAAYTGLRNFGSTTTASPESTPGALAVGQGSAPPSGTTAEGTVVSPTPEGVSAAVAAVLITSTIASTPASAGLESDTAPPAATDPLAQTATLMPTDTPVDMPTDMPEPPTPTPTATPTGTSTVTEAATPAPPTSTPIPPTATRLPPTPTSTRTPTRTPTRIPTKPPTRTAVPPTATPKPPTTTPEPAQVTTNDIVNIRRGPGTNYGLVGSAQAGETFPLLGKDATGEWWQIDYHGQIGWVFGQLITTKRAQGVPVAQNIPAPPTSAPVPATNTPAPQPSIAQWTTVRMDDSILSDSTINGYVDPPLGDVTLGGVPFTLPSASKNSFTTQAGTLAGNPQRVDIADLFIDNPAAVYLLVTGGYVRREFDGQKVGAIELHFDDGSVVADDLIAGANLREWKTYGDQRVTWTTDSNVTEVWRGANKFDDSAAIMDMLVVQIPSKFRSKVLESITVLDTSQSTVGSMDPAINVLGVSVQSN